VPIDPDKIGTHLRIFRGNLEIRIGKAGDLFSFTKTMAGKAHPLT